MLFRLSSGLLALLIATFACDRSAASDFDVVVNEIAYNPFTGENADEFIELFNRGGTEVDLSGWAFVEGIRFVFPDGVVMPPRSYLLVSSSAEFARGRFGVDAVVGDFEGRLDNGGEILMLVNDERDVISRIHFDDDNGWPESADGLGPTLELVDPFAQIDLPDSWAASRRIDGTPGAPNSARNDGRRPDPVGETVYIEVGESWRYLKGLAPFPADWRDVGFSDASWDTGETGIGYGDDDDATVLDDMEDGYLSFAARKTFHVDAAELVATDDLELLIDVDDGFIAHLNGQEVARDNMGAPGDEFASSEPSTGSREAGDFDTYSVPVELLVEGWNVLAVQVHNSDIDSSDASFIPRLVGRSVGIVDPNVVEGVAIVLNEIKGTESTTAGFIELFNRGSRAESLSGFSIVDSFGNSFSIPAGIELAPGEFASFGDAELGFDTGLAGFTYALLDGPGEFVDGFDPRPGLLGDNGFSSGRVPDGDNDDFVMRVPSPGAPNSVEIESNLVINEFLYHPPFIPPGESCERDCSDVDQWIEIHNRGGETIDLHGWQVSSAVSYGFPEGAQIGPGDHVVVCASRNRFIDRHPGVDPDIVHGDWNRSLSHDSETINLRDPLGNLADHVKYGDGGPQNDEEPEDGLDDRTIVASAWSPEPDDGTGRTLELVHPSLDNRHGGSWAAGAVGGSPGAPNDTFDPAPAPVIGSVENLPEIPLASQDVLVRCRVSAVDPVVEVRLLWRREGGGPSGSIVMRDDGLSGDDEAGDGRYGATIPGQPDDAIVAYRIEADTASATTLVPLSPEVAPYPGFEGPFFLYQVLNGRPSNGTPNYYIVMTLADQQEIESRDPFSNVLLPGTFIAEENGRTRVRHLCGLRYRGSSTRDEVPPSYKVVFASETEYLGFDRLNLNSQGTETEILAADLFFRAGLPVPQARTVNVTFQGSTNPRYVRKEHLASEFLERAFGAGSDDGNLYRAIDPDNDPREGDLRFYGDGPEFLPDYRISYQKRNNREEDDYSDIIELTRAFDPVETPDEIFVETIERLVDVNQWMRFLAVQSAIANTDGGIHSIAGEDYFLYHVPASSNRPDAGKWLLIPWDIEESYSDDNEELFRPSIAAIERLLAQPEFAPLYYCNLMNVRNGVFSRRETRQRFRLIDFLFSFGTIDRLDRFITARIGFYDEMVPVALDSGAEDGSSSAVRIIDSGDDWRYFKGAQEPSAAPLGWTAVDFDDSTWDVGPSGFGFEDSDDATVLDDMLDNYSTVYIRRRFMLGDASVIPGLTLSIDYDDGFVAYLNGVEVARREVAGDPGTPVPFDAETGTSHEAGQLEDIDISDFVTELRDGANVLAVQGVNRAIDSGDFSLRPELRTSGAATGGIGCGGLIYTSDPVVTLAGRANACITHEVVVDGALASYDPVLAMWVGQANVAVGENTILIESLDASGAVFDTLEITVVRSAAPLREVGGRLDADTTWSPGAPYHISSDVDVPDGVTLTIEPGAIFYCGDGVSIDVEGRIDALGSADEPIIFRGAACANRWRGIAIDGTGTGDGDPTHRIRHCDFQLGDGGTSGFIGVDGSKVLVENCSFRDLTANAIDGTSSRMEIRGCLFEKIEEGVHGTNASVIVLDCVFDGMVGDKDAIDFDGDGDERSRIERCLMMNGSDDGIDLGSNSVDIRDNVFINIQDKACSLERNGSLGAPVVTGNVIFNCGTGIALKNGVTVTEGEHNTIVGNQEGISLFSKDNAPDGGHGVFDSLIVWNNTFDVKVDALSSVSITYSNVSSGVQDGEGNISRDPRFVDVGRLDFSLRPGSPCIGTGLGGTDMGAIPFSGEIIFIRGDFDADGAVDITDVIATLDLLFRGGPAPLCFDRADTNDDGHIDISDAVRSLLFQFAGGRPLPEPFPGEGTDPTPDALECAG